MTWDWESEPATAADHRVSWTVVAVAAVTVLVAVRRAVLGWWWLAADVVATWLAGRAS